MAGLGLLFAATRSDFPPVPGRLGVLFPGRMVVLVAKLDSLRVRSKDNGSLESRPDHPLWTPTKPAQDPEMYTRYMSEPDPFSVARALENMGGANSTRELRDRPRG